MSDEEAALTLPRARSGDDASCAAGASERWLVSFVSTSPCGLRHREVGSAADLVVRDGQGAVRHVFAAGRLFAMVRWLARDLLAIRRKPAFEAKRLWQLMATIDP